MTISTSSALPRETKIILHLVAQRPFHLNNIFELRDECIDRHTLASENKTGRHDDKYTLADREVPSKQTTSQAQAAATRTSSSSRRIFRAPGTAIKQFDRHRADHNCTTFCDNITVVATALDKERPTSSTAPVVDQDGHSQPDIAPELVPEAGHRTHHRLLDTNLTPPLASAVTTAAATAPTADFEPPPPATVSVSASQPHGPTPAVARDLASTCMGGLTEMMLQSGLALLLCVAAVTAELSTAHLGMAVVYMSHDRLVNPSMHIRRQADGATELR